MSQNPFHELFLKSHWFR